jgi:hypothetical protein
MYTGLILKESLENTDILKDDRVTITKEETWNVEKSAVDWQPKVWTAIYVEGADKDVEDVAAIVSDSILDKWYANLSDSVTDFVIFRKKIFSYAKRDNDKKQEARKYGQSIGVPEHQLDW